jgi:hypothetical protein
MSSRFARFATTALLVALAACSASAPLGTQAPSSGLQSLTLPSGEHVIRAGAQTIRFGGLNRHPASIRPWISPAAKTKDILYGSSYDGGFINIYSQKGSGQSPIGQLSSNLTSPQGMQVDRRHQLWVANTNAFNVVAFKRGATTPFVTLNDPNYYPISVAVDTHDTVYAANAESTTGPPGNVTYWKKGSTNPSGTLTLPNFEIVLGIGVDAKNNVYVSYVPTSGPPVVAMFSAKTLSGSQLPMADTTISQITFDSSANLLMEDEYNQLGIWPSPYTGGPSTSLPLVFGNSPTLNKKETEVWVAYANFSTPKIEGFSYPGGTLMDTITSGYTTSAIPYDVALDPRATR